MLLSGVEYFLDEIEFLRMLRYVHERLLPGGMCMLISWSFDTTRLSQRFMAGIKDLARHVIEMAGVRTRGQFWGYIRRPEEFHRVISAAGFTHLRDGTLDTNSRWDTYWIEATKNG